jgi:hypothetical protein
MTDFTLNSANGNEYYVTLYLGSEEESVKMVPDTSSSWFMTIGFECVDCITDSISLFYNWEDSTTFTASS